VSYLEGRNFFVTGGGEDHLRLSFSLFDPPALAEGAKRLGEATRTVGDQLPRVAGGRPTPGTA
jgi:DNA-binding transcriptional MocR family regulator